MVDFRMVDFREMFQLSKFITPVVAPIFFWVATSAASTIGLLGLTTGVVLLTRLSTSRHHHRHFEYHYSLPWRPFGSAFRRVFLNLLPHERSHLCIAHPLSTFDKEWCKPRRGTYSSSARCVGATRNEVRRTRKADCSRRCWPQSMRARAYPRTHRRGPPAGYGEWCEVRPKAKAVQLPAR